MSSSGESREPLLLRRAAARFFDSGVLILLSFLLPIVLRRTTDFGEQEITALTSLAAAAVWWAYETVLVAAWGATIGKRLMQLRVVDLAGQRPTTARSAVRALPVLLLLDLLLGLVALVAWLSALFLSDGRGLHDRIAGTAVARAPWRPDATGD